MSVKPILRRVLRGPAGRLRQFLVERVHCHTVAPHALNAKPAVPESRPLPPEHSSPLELALGGADLLCKHQSFPGGVTAFLVLPLHSSDPILQAYAKGESPNAYMLELLAKTTIRGDRVIDLGCHVGTFSVGAAAMGRKVLAIDASPTHVSLIGHSKALNGFHDLRVQQAAVSSGQGVVRFVERGLFGAIDFSGSAAEAIDVPVKGLDDIVRDLGNGRVRFVKMDIEGAEFDAVTTGRKLLTSDRPVLLFESNGPTLRLAGHSIAELRRLLEAYDYKVFRVEGDRWVYAPPDQMQPEAWVDMLAVSEEDQQRWTAHIEWQWSPAALVQRCREWAALPHANTREYLLTELRTWRFADAIRHEIEGIARKLEAGLSNPGQGNSQ